MIQVTQYWDDFFVKVGALFAHMAIRNSKHLGARFDRCYAIVKTHLLFVRTTHSLYFETIGIDKERTVKRGCVLRSHSRLPRIDGTEP